MTHLKEAQRFPKPAISVRLQRFREAVTRKHGSDYANIYDRLGIPEDKFKKYENGRSAPDLTDLQSIALSSGVNLNWLVFGSGAMFEAQEKELADLIRRIESKKPDRYADYLMLLKMMQTAGIENLVFDIQKAFIKFLAGIGNK